MKYYQSSNRKVHYYQCSMALIDHLFSILYLSLANGILSAIIIVGVSSSSCVLPKGRSFSANSGTKAAVLHKGRSSTANSGTKVAVLLGINSCGSFLSLSAPHSLFIT